MHRGNWHWWVLGAAILAVILPVAWAIAAGIAWAVIYLLSLPVHPFILCRACSASGRRAGSFFSYTHRQCMTCGGQGRHRRLGVTVLYRGRQTWAEQRAQAARDTRRSRPM